MQCEHDCMSYLVNIWQKYWLTLLTALKIQAWLVQGKVLFVVDSTQKRKSFSWLCGHEQKRGLMLCNVKELRKSHLEIQPPIVFTNEFTHNLTILLHCAIGRWSRIHPLKLLCSNVSHMHCTICNVLPKNVKLNRKMYMMFFVQQLCCSD